MKRMIQILQNLEHPLFLLVRHILPRPSHTPLPPSPSRRPRPEGEGGVGYANARIWFLLFFVFLSLFFPASLGLGQQDEPVRFSIDVQPKEVFIGNQISVTFSLTYPSGTKVYFPSDPDVRPFVLVRHDKDVPHVAGQATNERHTLVLLPVRLGVLTLKPIEVPYVLPDGQARVAKTPELSIEVKGMLGDETEFKLAPPGDFVEVHVLNTPLVYGLIAVLSAIVATVLGIAGYRWWRRWKEAHKPPPPPRPPIEIALERLLKLEQMNLDPKVSYKEIALQVSDIVREFLGATYGFPGVDLTTYEVMQALKGKSLGNVPHLEVEDFLSGCDLIKFAKYVPTLDETNSIIPRARNLLNRISGHGNEV